MNAVELNPEREVFWKPWNFEVKRNRIKWTWLNWILRERCFENSWHFEVKRNRIKRTWLNWILRERYFENYWHFLENMIFWYGNAWHVLGSRVRPTYVFACIAKCFWAYLPILNLLLQVMSRQTRSNGARRKASPIVSSWTDSSSSDDNTISASL